MAHGGPARRKSNNNNNNDDNNCDIDENASSTGWRLGMDHCYSIIPHPHS